MVGEVVGGYEARVVKADVDEGAEVSNVFEGYGAETGNGQGEATPRRPCGWRRR